MDTKKALTILIEAVELAQIKGVFTLKQAGVISQAVEIFTKPKSETDVPSKTAESVSASKEVPGEVQNG